MIGRHRGLASEREGDRRMVRPAHDRSRTPALDPRPGGPSAARRRRRPAAGGLLLLGTLAGAGTLPLPADAQLTAVKVGWCARTVSAAATPFAVATRLAWYRQEGIAVELVPLPGPTEGQKNVTTPAGDLA